MPTVTYPNSGRAERAAPKPLIALALLLAWRRSRKAPARARTPPTRVAAATPSAERAVAEPERGRAAEKPSEIPAPGWKDILWRTFREVQADDMASVARGIAFTGIFALFPALAAFVSIYGLFVDVNHAREHLSALAGIVPADAMTLIGEQMVRIAAQQEAGLSLTAIFGVLLSLWSANGGMKALFNGLNIAYEEKEKRNFIKLNLITLTFTLGAIVALIVATAAIIVLPIALNVVGLDQLWFLSWLRWPVLLALTIVGLALLYRYGPSREAAKWRWVSYGSVTATVLWIAGSVLFSWYLSNFADYNATYGSLGSVFGFLMWLWLSAMVVLFGAELNSEIEHQTARDSTTGEAKPLGTRGARMADDVGEAKEGSILPGPIARRLHRS